MGRIKLSTSLLVRNDMIYTVRTLSLSALENKHKLARRHVLILPYYYERKNAKYFPRVRRVTCRRRCGCLLRKRGRIRRGKRRRNSPASGRRRGRVPSPSMSRWVFSKSFGSALVFVQDVLMIVDFGSRL
jgi:hypothetical protein